MARRRCGAVAITLRSRRPSSAMPSVRGIGVAVSVSTSTSARMAFIASLWRTPKRCSSSMMSRPRFLNLTDWLSSLCVPTTMSTVPSARPLAAAVISLAGAEAAHLGHLDRPLGEAVDQRLVVLLGQQRGGRQEGHLLAAGDGDEGGAQRDLGLAEAHVAADQAVHGAAGVIMSWITAWMAARLVGGFLEAEVVGEGLVVGRASSGRHGLRARRGGRRC